MVRLPYSSSQNGDLAAGPDLSAGGGDGART